MKETQTLIRQITRHKPAAYRHCGGGGETKKRYSKTNHRPSPPVYSQRGGGGGEMKKGENQHEIERWLNPESRERGKGLPENA